MNGLTTLRLNPSLKPQAPKQGGVESRPRVYPGGAGARQKLRNSGEAAFLLQGQELGLIEGEPTTTKSGGDEQAEFLNPAQALDENQATAEDTFLPHPKPRAH